MGSYFSPYTYETVWLSYFLPQPLKVEKGEGVLFELLMIWAACPFGLAIYRLHGVSFGLVLITACSF